MTDSQPLLRIPDDDYDPNSLPVAKAKELIARFLDPITLIEMLPIRNALGRVCAADLASPIDVPGHDNSAMDGYAARHADVVTAGATLMLVGTAFAGRPLARTIGPGECARIMTGAAIPAGADTVVMQEHVIREGEQIRFPAGVKPGQNVRRTGQDLARGQIAVARGRQLTPADVGLLASLGIPEVHVYRRLRVAFFSTGDELKSVGEPLDVGQIYDSNRYTLHGMLSRLGCEVLDLGAIPDQPEAIETALLAASRDADVVITSGGVSVGEADFIKDLLTRHGEVLFWKIAMKPGRPLAYGRIGQTQFFGLPGNPVSAMVTFYQFVRDALLRLAGVDPVMPLPLFRVTCTTPLKKAPGRVEFQRGRLFQAADGCWQVQTTGDQGSGLLSSMAAANCFIVLGQDVARVAAGDLVDVQPFEGLV